MNDIVLLASHQTCQPATGLKVGKGPDTIPHGEFNNRNPLCP